MIGAVINMQSDLFHGGMAAELTWDLKNNRIDFQQLALANWQLDLQTFPALPLALPQIFADQVTLENVSAIDLSKRFALNQATGTLEKLQ